MALENVQEGSTYYIKENGWGDSHFSGKAVRALEGRGSWGPSKVKVMCLCGCSKIAEVGVDKLM